MIFSIFVFIITLLILILIHELGHFLMAKKFGIKVLEFGFGIPPRAWGKKIGETLVSINWLPFGGFVRLLGEDLPAGRQVKYILNNPRSFAAKPVTQRFLVVLAGVVMNLFLAWIIFYITLSINGFKVQFPLLLEHQFLGATQQNETSVFISGVSNDSPAQKAGLKSGLQIVGVNSQQVLNGQQLIKTINDLAGEEISLTLKDQKGNLDTLKIIPRKNPPVGQGALGVELSGMTVANLEYQGVAKILAGPIHSWNIVAYSGKIIGVLVEQSLHTKSLGPVSQTVSGPVGVSGIVNDILTTAKNPLLSYLDFMAILSLNLAVFNVLPIPALDGGRIFFLLIEGLLRRKVRAEIEHWVHTVGMVLLLTLMLLVTLSDIKKFLP